MANLISDLRRRLKLAFSPLQVQALESAFGNPLSARLMSQITLGGTALDATAARPELSLSLEAGKFYRIEFAIFGAIAITAGAQFDFAGGSVSATTFVGRQAWYTAAGAIEWDVTAALGTAMSTAVAQTAGLFTASLLVNQGGLLVPRINRVGAGTTTIDVGTFITATQIANPTVA